MDVRGFTATDIGNRKDNEDHALANDDLGLYIVCDGMGGHPCGEVAAATSAAIVQRTVEERRAVCARARRDPERFPDVVELLVGAIREAAREVHHLASTRRGCAGMGCSLTALLVAGRRALMAHVGGSRLYLARAGKLAQLTSDHTTAAELVQIGAMEPALALESRHARSLTRALGPQPDVMVETLEIDLMPGDRFLLCSNGLFEPYDRDALLKQLTAAELAEDVAEALVAGARAAGGEDNATAVVVEVEASSPVAVEAQTWIEGLYSAYLFQNLSLVQVQRVLNAASVRAFIEGEVVLREGTQCEQLYLQLEGRCSLARGEEIVGHLDVGDCAGESTLVRPRPCRSTLAARERSQLIVLTREQFFDLARRWPALGVTLLERLSRSLSTALDRAYREERLPLTALRLGDRF